MHAIEQLPIREKVAAVIRKAIYAGEYEPGTEIDVQVLCENLKVSRTPVREALQLLAGEGLVELPMNRCATVVQIDAQFIRDHYEFRALLEGFAAQQATKNHMDTAELLETAGRFLSAPEKVTREEYKEFNNKLHFSILQAANNRPLTKAMQRMWTMPGSLQTDLTVKERVISTEEHIEMLICIADGKAEKARRLMEQHIMDCCENNVKAFQMSNK